MVKIATQPLNFVRKIKNMSNIQDDQEHKTSRILYKLYV